MDKILHPIIVALAWIWVRIHDLLVLLGISDGPGIGWILSIVLLTLLIRLAIVPLYIKQMRSSREMQKLQPQVQKINKKYEGKKDQVSLQRKQEETSALYKRNKVSPFASCLPSVVQLPFIFALYRVIFAMGSIKDGRYDYPSLGPLNQEVAAEIDQSMIFGVPLSHTMGVTEGTGKIAFVVFIAIMVIFQFLTMRMSVKRNMPAMNDEDAQANPMVRTQKMMMYFMPLMFIFTGFVFQMGLLVYMVTSTLFAWFQQLLVVNMMPTPGSPAYEDLRVKRQARYQAWSQPLFVQYDKSRADLEGNEDALAKLEIDTVAKAAAQAKKQRVAQKFPEDWTKVDELSVYRGLSQSEWKVLPDESWLRDLVRKRSSSTEKKEARRTQPKKLSREQRMRQTEIERLEAEREERRDRRQSKKDRPGGDLSAEEIERRRAQRKAEERRRRRNKSGK